MAETADIQTQPFYLKKAKLKGYKSIKDAEVEFCDGLNIIIGKNASGKSNLLEFLYNLLSFKEAYHSNINAELILQGIKNLQLSTKFSLKKIDLNSSFNAKNEKAEHIVIYDNKEIEKPFKKFFGITESFLSPSFIKYNIPDPKNTPIIDSPFRFTFDSFFYSKEIVETTTNHSHKLIFFIFLACWRTMIKTHSINPLEIKPLDLNILKDEINSRINKKIKELNNLFEGLVPIEIIRFNPEFNIHFDENSDIYTFSNLYIEYKIDGNWMLYSNLSDGTKRLFYVVSELFFGHRKDKSFDPEFLKHEKIEKNIFLLEEPELGIHPHQLHQLMTFIKEQSRDKQIILSTHSPMVLDILDKDDLHRIIIASNDDPKKGSQFRHLTEEEKDKAKLYMEDYFLSDYWKHSDLEK